MHLQLEKSLSKNTVEAYTLDLDKLIQYISLNNIQAGPAEIKLKDLQSYLKWIAELGMSERSQTRILSGIKSFYRYCLQEQITKTDPTELLSAPKQNHSQLFLCDRWFVRFWNKGLLYHGFSPTSDSGRD